MRALRLTCLFAVAVGLAACGSKTTGPPPGTTPMQDLIKAGKAPLEVVAFTPMLNPMMPQFKLVLKNVSDKDVKAVKWTALFLDKDGKLLPDGKQDGGYAELGGIAAGETLEGVSSAVGSCASGRLVIQSVVYETLPPGAEKNEAMSHMRISMVWKNPTYEAEVAAAK